MLRFLASALLLASFAAAQVPVTLTGRIQSLPANPCDPTATHSLECSGILLKSSTVDLNQLQGNMEKLTGTLDLTSGLGCTVLDVTAAEAERGSTSSFSLGGYRIGSSVLMTTFAPLGNGLATVLSFGDGFLPLGPLGSVLVDPLQAEIYSFGVSFGINVENIRIPNDTNLVGLVPHFQVLALDLLNPTDGELLNAHCFEIR